MQKYIYLILSSSSSVPAKLIKFFSKNDLNHSSISLDPSLTEMYSFGRLKMWNAFYGGFVKEHKDKGFYEKFTDTYVNIYRFPVSDNTYEYTKKYLTNCYMNKDAFKYNLLGVALAKFDVPLCRDNQYFCSEFVAKVFSDCNIRKIERNIHTYRPYYFLELDDKELVYDGLLRDYDVEMSVDENDKADIKEPVYN